MIVKNSIILSLLLLSLFLTALLATAALATQAILGYTGLEGFNNKQGLITLNENCPQSYFIQKYNDSLNISFSISFICEMVAVACLLTTLLIIILFVCKTTNSDEQRSEMTGIEDQKQNRNMYMQISYPSNLHIVGLYVSLSLLCLSSLVSFKQFLQYLIEQDNQFCPLSLNSTPIRAISILNGLMLIFSLTAMSLLLALNCRVHQRLNMLQMASESQSFRHQIQRMIRQLPESQRRFNQKNNMPVFDLQNLREQKDKPRSSCFKKEKEPPSRNEVDLQKMPKVESIYYNQSPSLHLQSIVSEN